MGGGGGGNTSNTEFALKNSNALAQKKHVIDKDRRKKGSGQ